MILVDTSVWIEHLRNGHPHLQSLLLDGKVLGHELIIGELACGNLKNREEILSLLKTLPDSPRISFDEFLYFVEKNKLFGKGIGFVDIHLMASAALAGTKLWTLDRRLAQAAAELDLKYRM